MGTKTGIDTVPSTYQAGLLLAALADDRRRIPSDAKGRTLDIMLSRQWVREYTADGRRAAAVPNYPGFTHFRLTHHGINAARKVKAQQEAAETAQTPEEPQPQPRTEIKDSSQLAEGDIVRDHGMRVRLDELTTTERQGLTVYHWAGTVLNIDEVREAQHVPMSFLRTTKWEAGRGWVTDREDYWAVQGNKLATWAVEVPDDRA
ncbi:hypothetical protein ACPCAG_31325 [Streptomyces pseudogriseolus]|uniref:hypothetical protein n=1 Tax=Streptomyces pseudogriseolus TaxID=36817 RepID=UPI003FA33E3F